MPLITGNAFHDYDKPVAKSGRSRKDMDTITVKDGTQIYKDWGTGQPLFFHHGWPAIR
jgi:hypothetical protein